MAKQSSSADPDLITCMQAAGHADPAHLAIAERAIAAGVPKAGMIDWLKGNQAVIFQIIKTLLDLIPPAPPMPPAPPATKAP